jgi:hypothetical protein
MMTDGRQRRTPAATQLPSILSEFARRARLDMRKIEKRRSTVTFASPVRGCVTLNVIHRRASKRK